MIPPAVRAWLEHPERVRIASRLRDAFAAPDIPLDDAVFSDLALSIHRLQREFSAPYRRLCESGGAGREPAAWQAIPAVPAEAFRTHRLACFPAFAGEIVFESSGTTSGSPGRHCLPDTALYDAAAIPWFARNLLDGAVGERLAWFSLTGSPRSHPRSSLVHMIAAAAARHSPESGPGWYFEGDSLESDRLLADLERCGNEGRSVFLLATAFALVHLLDRLEAEGRRVPLPPGSRLMETGGYKGRSRTLDRRELREWTIDRLGLAPGMIAAEYGMSEMSSQFHEGLLPEADSPAARPLVAPPWVRTLILDPATGEESPPGTPGRLVHFDLANLDSCAFIRTGDLGRRAGDGIELLGRAPHAESRGCSLEYE